MGANDKSRKIGDSAKEINHYAEEQRLGHGRIEFDELGNAIWVPVSGNSSDEVMRRLLDDPTLAFSADYSARHAEAHSAEPARREEGLRPVRQRPAGQEGMEEEEGPAQAFRVDQVSANPRTNDRLTLRAGTRSLARMTPLTLVVGSRNYSSWSLRPWLLLRHLGLEFTEHQILLDTPEFDAEIGKFSPTRRVPVLIHGEMMIWESLAICEYVSELSGGRGWPAEAPLRAMARALSAEMHSGFRGAAQRLPDECARDRSARADDAGGRAATCGASTRSGRDAGAITATAAPGSSAISASRTRCTRRSCCACAATGCRSRRSRRRYLETMLSDPHLREWIDGVVPRNAGDPAR